MKRLVAEHNLEKEIQKARELADDDEFIIQVLKRMQKSVEQEFLELPPDETQGG